MRAEYSAVGLVLLGAAYLRRIVHQRQLVPLVARSRRRSRER